MAFVLGFLVTVGYLPLPDGAHAGRWAALSILVPLLLFVRQFRGILFPFLFPIMMAASLAWSPTPWTGLDQLWHFALAAAVVAIAPPLEAVLLGAGAGLAVNAAVALAQAAGFSPVEAATGNAGLFMNSNAQAEAIVLVVVGLAGQIRTNADLSAFVRLCAFAGVISVPLALPPLPRGALVALAVAATLALPRLYRIAAFALAGLLAFILITPERVPAVAARAGLWLDVAERLTFWGQGLGGFAYFFPYWQYAHNDAIQIAHDLGVPGLVAFASVVAFCLWRGTGSARAVLVAFVVEGAFSFPLYQPTTLFLAACAVGSILGRRPDLRGDLAHREPAGEARPATIRAAWPGAGVVPVRRHDLPAAAELS